MAQMSTKQRTTKHSKNAALLSIIPGLGQIYNKQVIKGIMFLVFFLAFGFCRYVLYPTLKTSSSIYILLIICICKFSIFRTCFF